jgi:erythromycin esterase
MPGDSQAAYLGNDPLEYLLSLESGDSVRIEVRQYGTDVAAIILSPTGEQLLRVDNLFNQYGPEWIEFTARRNGKHVLRIELSYPDAPRGIFEAAFVERADRAAAVLAEAQRLSLKLGALAWVNERGMVLGPPETTGSPGWLEVAKRLARHRIVGIGEATHGSREFRLGANRMIQDLVSNHGFRCLILEMDPEGARALDRFVNGDAGSASGVVSSLRMWVWSTEELAVLMDWLRTFVATTHERVRIDGMDSFNVRAAALPVKDAVAGRGLPEVPTDFDDRAVLGGWLQAINSAVSDPGLAARHAEFRDARRWTRLALTGLDAQALDDAAAAGLRDLAMAETVSNLVEWEPECAKAVVWAHNYHVALKAYGAPVREPMGAHLRRQWGNQYAAWGSAFTEGSFLATDPTKGVVAPFSVKADPSESLDGMLGQTSAQVLAVDFSVLKDATPANEWFNAPQKTRSIGGGYLAPDPDAAFARPVPAETFDGLVWHRRTEATRPLEH